MQTTISRSIGGTPFASVYGIEAVLPAEVEHRSFRTESLHEATTSTHEMNDHHHQDELNKDRS